MDRAAKTNDDIVFMRLDRELNLLISAAAHNDYATRAMRSLHGHSRRFWYLHYKQAADLPLCARCTRTRPAPSPTASPSAPRGDGPADRLHGNLHRAR